MLHSPRSDKVTSFPAIVPNSPPPLGFLHCSPDLPQRPQAIAPTSSAAPPQVVHAYKMRRRHVELSKTAPLYLLDPEFTAWQQGVVLEWQPTIAWTGIMLAMQAETLVPSLAMPAPLPFAPSLLPPPLPLAVTVPSAACLTRLRGSSDLPTSRPLRDVCGGDGGHTLPLSRHLHQPRDPARKGGLPALLQPCPSQKHLRRPTLTVTASACAARDRDARVDAPAELPRDGAPPLHGAVRQGVPSVAGGAAPFPLTCPFPRPRALRLCPPAPISVADEA